MAECLIAGRGDARLSNHSRRVRPQFEILIRGLRTAPRWLLLAALIYAPWDYGCTTEHGIIALDWILGAALLLWIIDLLVARRFPAVPFVLVIVSVLLLGIGWWMVLNAHSIYDSDYYIFIPISTLLHQAPGSIDQAISVAWMLRGTILLGTACLVADLSQRPQWLLRLWWSIGIAGSSIALLGLLQKATNAPMIFWRSAPVPGVRTFFATYYYHANAGAFLNLTLPLICGLALRGWIKPTMPMIRAIWSTATIILLAATLANTSRMGQLISLLLVMTLAAGWSKLLMRRATGGEGKGFALGLVVVMTAFLAVAQASHLDQPLRRWEMLAQHLPADARWLASQAALGATNDAGWFGFGPGTFRIIFPYYTGRFGDRLAGIWRFLHEDYLQTVLEWGWIGSALWGVFLFGGIAVGIRNLWSLGATGSSTRHRSFLFLAVLALAGVALHALIDFPLQIASLQLYVATYLGVCWGSDGWRNIRITRVQAAVPETEPSSYRR